MGTSGFSYPDWHGPFYPSDFKKRKIHELEFLSRFFDFCEINNSFYRPVNPEVAGKWCQFVANNKEFRFTAKLTEVFTHAPGRGNKESSSAETIRYTSQDVDDAKKGFEPIASAGRLGALLLQFPISFKYTEGNWDHLIDVLPVLSPPSLTSYRRSRPLGDTRSGFTAVYWPVPRSEGSINIWSSPSISSRKQMLGCSWPGCRFRKKYRLPNGWKESQVSTSSNS